MSSWLNAEVYCLFRMLAMLALSLAPEISSPFYFSGDVPVRSSFDALMNFQNLFWFL